MSLMVLASLHSDMVTTTLPRLDDISFSHYGLREYYRHIPNQPALQQYSRFRRRKIE